MIAKSDKDIEQELFYYYYETGLYLINCGKLINKDVISFIDKIDKFKVTKFELPDEVYKGIILNDDEKFITTLLNNDDYYIRKDYIKMIKAFFDNFKTLTDFSHLKKWNKNNCDNDDVFYMFL